MRPTRRTVLSAAATLGFLPVLGGCGREEVTVLDTDAEVQLVFWSGQSDDAATVLQGLVDEFQRCTPTCTWTCPPVRPRRRNCCRTRRVFAADEAPDISYTFGSWASQLERSGRTLDVTAVVADPEVGGRSSPRPPATPPAPQAGARSGSPPSSTTSRCSSTPRSSTGPAWRTPRPTGAGRTSAPRPRPPPTGVEHLRVRLLGLGQRGDDLAAVAAPVAERRGGPRRTGTGRSAFQSDAGVERWSSCAPCRGRPQRLPGPDRHEVRAAVRERPRGHDDVGPVGALGAEDRGDRLRGRPAAGDGRQPRDGVARTCGRCSTTATSTARTGRRVRAVADVGRAGRTVQRRRREPAPAVQRGHQPRLPRPGA